MMRAEQRVVCWLVTAGLLTFSAQPSYGENGRGQEGVETLSSPETKQLTLAPRDQWRRVGGDGVFRVSPTWSPDGAKLMVAGYLGKGVYVIDGDGREATLDARHEGPRRWLAEGDGICLAGEETDRVVWLADKTNERETCSAQEIDPEKGERLYRDAELEIFHHPYRGTLMVSFSDGRDQILEEGSPWDVSVAPSGRRVAFCLGTLAEPELVVLDLEDGRAELGRGAHPTWGPDGRSLVYTKTGDVQDRDGTSTFLAAELAWFDLETDTTVQLSHTEDIVEMEPVLSPTGDMLAVSDWRSGAIYLIPVVWK